MKNHFTNTVWFWNLLVLFFGAIGVWSGFVLSKPDLWHAFLGNIINDFSDIPPSVRFMFGAIQIISFIAVSYGIFMVLYLLCQKCHNRHDSTKRSVHAREIRAKSS